MCLAIPMKVVEINKDEGLVELGGARRVADLSMVQPVNIGQYVIVHAGFAISVIDEDEAKKTLELFNELIEKQELK